MESFSGWHWFLVVLVGLVVVTVIRMSTSSAKASAGTPVGVGGWLILSIIGFVGVIALTLFNLISALKEIEGLEAIFEATDGPLTRLQLPLLFSSIFGIAVICSASICLFRIFVSEKDPKYVAVAHYLLLATAGFIELWADHELSTALPDSPSDPAVFRDAARGLFAAFIWIPYFLVSKRVKNTFGNGHRLTTAEE